MRKRRFKLEEQVFPRVLLEDGEVKDFIRCHLLDESGDVFSESSRISLCLDDSSLKRYFLIEVCLVFDIWSTFPICEYKRIDERKFESTDICAHTLASVKRTEFNTGARKC